MGSRATEPDGSGDVQASGRDVRSGASVVQMEPLTEEEAASALDDVVGREIRRVRTSSNGAATRDAGSAGADEDADEEERRQPRDRDHDEYDDDGDNEDDADGDDDDVDDDAREPSDDTVLKVGDTDVTLGELKENFGAGSAATDLERRELEEIRKEYETRNNDLAEAYHRVIDWVEKSIVPQEPNMQLLTDNPKEYMVQKELRSTVLNRLNEIAQQRDALVEKDARTAEKELAALRRIESEKLQRAMPELASTTKRSQFQERIRKTARTLGFNEKEIGSTFDHRVLMTMHFAGLGMAAERNRKAATRRQPEKARRGPPPGRVAGRITPDRKDTAARVRLKKTGKLEDAAAIVESMMGLRRR